MLFRKLSREWRYGISELMIVVVGVLIALGAESWRSSLSLREAESASLGRLGSDMAVDIDDIMGNLSRTRRGYEAATWLMQRRHGPWPTAAALSARITDFTACSILSSNTSEYTALKSSGQLANLRDTGFRQKLVNHYEAYPYLSALYDLDCRTMEDAIAAIESYVEFGIDPTAETLPISVASEPQDVLQHATFQHAVAYAAQIRTILATMQEDALSELRTLRHQANELAAH